MAFTITLQLIILAIAAIIAIFGFERIWETLFGPPDLGRVVFKDLKRSKRPHDALVAPEGFCPQAKTDRIAPCYKVNANQLREFLRESLKAERDLQRVHTNDPAMRERYLSRSKTMRFPDTIQVEYIDLGNDRSTIAVYATAQIGYRDFGANLKRTERWLKRLKNHETPCP